MNDAGNGRLDPSGDLDLDAIQRRAYELSQLNPDASSEENWLRAEAATREEEAELRAKIEMAVFEHP